MKRTAVGVFVAALALLEAPGNAPAGTPPLVIVAGAPADEALTLRVAAELRASGLAVRVLDASEELPTPAVLERLVRDAGAAGAVRVLPARRGVEVWIVDRALDLFTAREVVRPRADTERDESLAVRATEVLRASLIDVELPLPSLWPEEVARAESRPVPAPVRTDGPATTVALLASAPVAAPVAPRRTGAAVHAAAGVWGAARSDGLAPSIVAAAGLAARRGRLAASLEVLVPLSTSRVASDVGSARVTTLGALVGGEVAALTSPRWRVALGLLAGVGWLHARGFAQPRYRGANDAAFGALFALRPSGAFRLVGPAWVRVALHASVVTPHVHVSVAGERVATWGPLLLGAAAGLELVW